MELSDKILLGVIGFDPKSFKKESEEIQYLINGFSIGFARWCLFMNNQTDNFDKLEDNELIEMYKQDCEERIKTRLRK